MALLTIKQNALLLTAGFTQREIDTQSQKFHNLFQIIENEHQALKAAGPADQAIYDAIAGNFFAELKTTQKANDEPPDP